MGFISVHRLTGSFSCYGGVVEQGAEAMAQWQM
jgi:hypothetical protein